MNRYVKMVVVLTGLCSGLSLSDALAELLPLTADGYARHVVNHPSSWYGSSNNWDRIYTGNFLNTNSNETIEERGILKFDISGIVSDVQNAVLHLNVHSKQGSLDNVYLYRIPVGTYNMVEGSDWGASDSYTESSKRILCTPSTNVGDWVTVDVTDLINSARSEGESYIAFRLQKEPIHMGRTELWGFISSENSQADRRPYLEYTLVPEPTTVGILMMGLFGLVRQRQ